MFLNLVTHTSKKKTLVSFNDPSTYAITLVIFS